MFENLYGMYQVPTDWMQVFDIALATPCGQKCPQPPNVMKGKWPRNGKRKHSSLYKKKVPSLLHSTSICFRKLILAILIQKPQGHYVVFSSPSEECAHEIGSFP